MPGLLRLMKFKAGDLHRIQYHNERRPDEPTSHSNPDIDRSRTHLNIVWKPHGAPEKLFDRCRARRETVDAERLQRGGKKQKNRSNETPCCEFLVNMASAMKRIEEQGASLGKSPDEIRRRQMQVIFEALRWLRREFGRENCVGWAIHFDEAGRGCHLHYTFVPVCDPSKTNHQIPVATKKNRANLPSVAASALFSEASLAKLQHDIFTDVFRRYQSRYKSAYEIVDGEYVKVRESRRHLDTPEYKEMMRRVDAARATLDDINTQIETASATLTAKDVEICRADAALEELAALNAAKRREHQQLREEIATLTAVAQAEHERLRRRRQEEAEARREKNRKMRAVQSSRQSSDMPPTDNSDDAPNDKAPK